MGGVVLRWDDLRGLVDRGQRWSTGYYYIVILVLLCVCRLRRGISWALAEHLAGAGTDARGMDGSTGRKGYVSTVTILYITTITRLWCDVLCCVVLCCVVMCCSILYIIRIDGYSNFKSPASNYRGFGASTSDSRRFSMKHRPEIGKFCFCCKMFDRKTWNYVEIFCRFCFCGPEWIFYTSCCSLACHVSIADRFVPFIGREYVDTWHIDTWHILIGRSTLTELWSDGPPICEIWKKNYELGGNLLTRGMLIFVFDF
jgi:hypothetical protein